MEQRELLRFLRLQRWSGFPVPGKPEFDEVAYEKFVELLGASKGYLEFGSGGSTLVADRLGICTLTVESDRYYARRVREALSERTPVTIMDVRIGLTRHWSTPIFTRPSVRRLRRWRRYSREPFLLLDKLRWFPDFVLIDGRFRRACILEAARQTLRHDHPVTVMVDDYFKPGRQHYHAVERWLGVPTQIGRAAFFHIDPQSSMPEPSESDIEEAAKDFR